MVELLRYLEANGFTAYIASGGSRDFMRAVAGAIYGIPPERVVGSSNALGYREDEHGGSVVYHAQPDVFDDGPAKPVRIWSRIGRRPIVAVGNSNGDIPMLRFASHPSRPSLRCSCSTTTPSASSSTSGAPTRRSKQAGDGVGRRQHARRLVDGVRGRLMGQAIGQILPFAVGVGLSPVPIIAVVVMLVDAAGARERPGVPARLARRAHRRRHDRVPDLGRGRRDRRRRAGDLGRAC